jgi:hypothetical protein
MSDKSEPGESPATTEDGIIEDYTELDFTRHKEIKPLGENRYVYVSDETTVDGKLYTISGTIHAPEKTSPVTVKGNDVVAVFSEFMQHYAQTVAPDDDPQEIINLLVKTLLSEDG